MLDSVSPELDGPRIGSRDLANETVKEPDNLLLREQRRAGGYSRERSDGGGIFPSRRASS